MSTSPHIYNAEISAGSLMLRESRKIAALLQQRADEVAWQKALYTDNILQKKVRSTARRMARLIRNRLELMTPELWALVIDGASEVAIQAVMAAAVKHSRLLGDFLVDIVKEHHRTFNNQISPADWKRFLGECERRDPAVASWSDSTKAKLGQVIFRILAEAKYVDSPRSLHLAPVTLFPEIRAYLTKHKETYVLACMDVSHG
jgi:hypothetical protein